MKKLAVLCSTMLFVAGITVNAFAGIDGNFAGVATGGTSIFTQEVAETIFDNLGNYTFFQKQGTENVSSESTKEAKYPAGNVDDRDGITIWVKGFDGKEAVDFGYKKFDADYYGILLGVDTDRKYTDNFDATYGIFAAYTEGTLDKSEKARLNGGYIGARAIWYINKLFFGAIADFGLRKTKVEANSDEQDFDSQSLGVALKAGYNFEVSNKSFTIQPNIVFNSDFDISEGFNLDGTKVESDDYFNMSIVPGIKAAKNLGRCWILSGEAKYFVVSSDGKVEIDDTNTYDKYYSDFFLLGLGVEKIWGYTVLHCKINKSFSGRDGWLLNAGIEFKF